jgi:hypothetical protein
MKKAAKRLAFNPTTVRVLHSQQLERAAGGGSSNGSGDSHITCSVTFIGSCVCTYQYVCASERMCDESLGCDSAVC